MDCDCALLSQVPSIDKAAEAVLSSEQTIPPEVRHYLSLLRRNIRDVQALQKLRDQRMQYLREFPHELSEVSGIIATLVRDAVMFEPLLAKYSLVPEITAPVQGGDGERPIMNGAPTWEPEDVKTLCMLAGNLPFQKEAAQAAVYRLGGGLIRHSVGTRPLMSTTPKSPPDGKIANVELLKGLLGSQGRMPFRHGHLPTNSHGPGIAPTPQVEAIAYSQPPSSNKATLLMADAKFPCSNGELSTTSAEVLRVEGQNPVDILAGSMARARPDRGPGLHSLFSPDVSSGQVRDSTASVYSAERRVDPDSARNPMPAMVHHDTIFSPPSAAHINSSTERHSITSLSTTEKCVGTESAQYLAPALAGECVQPYSARGIHAFASSPPLASQSNLSISTVSSTKDFNHFVPASRAHQDQTSVSFPRLSGLYRPPSPIQSPSSISDASSVPEVVTVPTIYDDMPPEVVVEQPKWLLQRQRQESDPGKQPPLRSPSTQVRQQNAKAAELHRMFAPAPKLGTAKTFQAYTTTRKAEVSESTGLVLRREEVVAHRHYSSPPVPSAQTRSQPTTFDSIIFHELASSTQSDSVATTNSGVRYVEVECYPDLERTVSATTGTSTAPVLIRVSSSEEIIASVSAAGSYKEAGGDVRRNTTGSTPAVFPTPSVFRHNRNRTDSSAWLRRSQMFGAGQ